MRHTLRMVLGSLLLAGSVPCGPALAQDIAVIAAPSGFGIEDNQVVTLPYSAFREAFPGASRVASDFALGGVRVQDEFDFQQAYLIAPIDGSLVPNGALITGFAAYVRDADGGADDNIRVELCRNWIDVDGTNPGFDCPYSVHSAGSPGDDALVSSDDLLVRYRYNVDSDGVDEFVGYMVRVTYGVDTKLAAYVGDNLWLRQVRLFFRRQISPAPPAATFSDVPLSHPASQVIEALAASGVSQGCGGGKFCPDDPVTRAQVAMFLARALGLHWPAF